MDGTSGRASRSKLWIGFGLMCVGVLMWMFSIKWAMSSMDSLTRLAPGASAAEVQAAAERMDNPMRRMSAMMIGYSLSGLTFVGGMVVTAMGLIDYAAEVRRRG